MHVLKAQPELLAVKDVAEAGFVLGPVAVEVN